MKFLISILGIAISTILISYFFMIDKTHRVSVDSIQVLYDNPRKFDGKKITIKGTVKFSLDLGIKFFILKDNSGEIYIKTDHVVPDEDERIEISGTFKELFKVGNKRFPIIMED